MNHVASSTIAIVTFFGAAFPCASQQDDLVISSNAVGSFRYGESVQRIWPSLGNKSTDPTVWQFRYDPLFLPEVDTSGALVFTETGLPDKAVKIQVPIDLDNGKAQKLAFEQVKMIYPDVVQKLQQNDVFALDVDAIEVSIPEMESLNIGAEIVNPKTSFFTQANSFTIAIKVPSKEAATVVEQLLPTYRIDYKVSFKSKSARQNVIKINYKDMRSSNLFSALNGLGTSVTYVHRDDLRKLTEGINSEISSDVTIEEPSQFDQTLYEKILAMMTTAVNTETAQFDTEKWKSTYNGDDLKPTQITKFLNNEFNWDQTAKKVDFKGTADTGGKVNLFDEISAEGKAAGSYSQDNFQSELHKHGLEVSFEGNEIIAKSLDLQQVNMSQFAQDQQFSNIVTLVSDQMKVQDGSIDIERLLATGVVSTTIPTQVKQIWDTLQSNAADDKDRYDKLVAKINDEFTKLYGIADAPSHAYSEVMDVDRYGGSKGAKGQPLPRFSCPGASFLYGTTAYEEDHEAKEIFYCKSMPKLEVK
jgi:hypothetical protein